MKKILLTNDDGVNAPGINDMNDYLRKEGHHTIVIAPEGERSTTGHSLSLDKPLRLHEVRDEVYSCTGFPADCTLMGLGHVLKEDRPKLVVSGINRGANLSQDMYYSGTMAGAREASFHGVPSISVSLDCAFASPVEEVRHYKVAAKIVDLFIKKEIEKYIPFRCMININVPNIEYSELKGVKHTKLGFRDYNEHIEKRVDSRGRDYFWINGSLQNIDKGDGTSDAEVVRDGYVSVTTLDILDRGEDFSKVISIIEEVNKSL